MVIAVHVLLRCLRRQSWRVLGMGLQRLLEKDMARHVPVRGPVITLSFVRALKTGEYPGEA